MTPPNSKPPGFTEWRKKPVTIKAAQWFKNGDHPEDYAAERTGFEGGQITTFFGEHAREHDWEAGVVRRFRHPETPGTHQCMYCNQTMHHHGWIDTLEGGHVVCPGDWIITGVQGERYPCKPAIFAATYEPASTPSGADGWRVTDEMVERASKAYFACNWRSSMKEKMRAALEAAPPPPSSSEVTPNAQR